MNIRPETPSDYAAIAEVNYRAFDNRLMEPLVVTLHRHRARFDPELSLVAEADGRMVGHALFSPQTIRLLGQDVPAVCLGPIAVEPDHHGQGIGAALIHEGHTIARNKGYFISYLLGHETYYPRFGYQTGVFGVSSVDIPANALGLDQNPNSPLSTRTPQETDLPALRQLWLHEEGEVDFSVYPGDSVFDWRSPNPAIQAEVYTRDETVVGYTRIHRDEPQKPRMFLASDAETARQMAGMFMRSHPSITLPLHPYSGSGTAFMVGPTVQAWNAAMACRLAPGVFDEYAQQRNAGNRLLGRPIWPVAFDL